MDPEGPRVASFQWIAREWRRLEAIGAEHDTPTRGARIAAALSEYDSLATAVGVSTDPMVVAATFGEQMAQRSDEGRYPIRPESELPYPRPVIRAALHVMAVATQNEKRRTSIGPVLVSLAGYVKDQRIAAHQDAYAKAAAFYEGMLAMAKAGAAPTENNLRDLTTSYEPEALQPLEDLVREEEIAEILDLETRHGDVVGRGQAFGMWLMVSADRIVRAAEKVIAQAETVRCVARDPFRPPTQ